MEGRGVYNRSSRVQAAGLSPAVPLLEQAARTVALPAAPEPIVIVDYGSSEGHNSFGPLAAAIRGRQVVLRSNSPLQQYHTGVELLVGAMAESGAGPDSGSSAGRL